VAVQDKLNAQWTSKEQGEAVFRVRAIMQNAYMVLQETVSQIDAITASASFTTVDAEIKTSGGQIRTILNQSKAALDAHAAFLNWKQPIG
jgi:hypothetical protein